MNRLNQYRLIDIMSHIDMSLVEEDFPEGDLDKLELFPQEKKGGLGKKIAIISGIAAGSIALTGAVVFAFKKIESIKKAA